MSHIFVFGSSLAGRHGLGAAYFARKRCGAIYGQGEGLQGNSYAIPTKSKDLKTLSLEQIERKIHTFIKYAGEHLEHQFYITRIGSGLAGYSWFVDIQPLFPESLPINCKFVSHYEAQKLGYLWIEK